MPKPSVKVEKKVLYLLVGVVAGLIGLIVLSGCISGPTVTYDYRISKPYDIKSGVMEMKADTSAILKINNSNGGDLRFRVDKATLTANYEDGKRETIEGRGSAGTVPAGGTYEMELGFRGVPMAFTLVDNPPRFHSMVESYDVNVTYTGQTKILFIWSPEKTEAKNIHIPIKDIPVDDYFSKIGDMVKKAE